VIWDVISSALGGKRTLPSKEAGQNKKIKMLLFKDKYGLTDDQTKTLSLMTRGLTNSQIADELGSISVGGVDKKVMEIFRKMDVHTRLQAAEKAKSEWMSK
jgi:DNA-binding NarL/FixJ family response regulator